MRPNYNPLENHRQRRITSYQDYKAAVYEMSSSIDTKK